jgi:hypothetical protein
MMAAAIIGLFSFLVVFAVALGLKISEPPARALADKRTSVAVVPSRFFGRGLEGTAAVEMPIDAFLGQLERHIRLEHAAAENFLDQPSSENLHAPTTSTLVN